MLYLAEVQKKAGILGSGKAEFKLLACQRNEQSWTAVSGEEIIGAPDDAGYNAGCLVMVDLSNSRQVQRHYEAGRSLVSILQNFSNLSKKFKTQEEEIEQWKQSLTFQSQELNRRELEIETRQEQIEQAEADLEQVEAQRQELEQSKQELDQLKAELTRKNQELEGAWAHLNGEMRLLEERQAELSQKGSLDEAQVAELQDALNRLTGAMAPTEGLRDCLNASFEAANHQQNLIDQHRNTLEQQRAELEQRRQGLEQQSAELHERWLQWRQAEVALAARKAEVKLQQQLIAAKQDRIQFLSDELHRQGSLHQKIYDLLNTSDKVRLSKKVDVAALESMSIEELQTLVSDLEQDLEKMSRFVSDQEEELGLQQTAIDEVKTKIEQANEFDRLQLEAVLAEEQDCYQMLNETLVGQRRNLLERKEVLSQHQAILRRRQGLEAEETPVNAVDLEPLLDSLDEQRQVTNTLIQTLEIEVKQAQEAINPQKQEIEEQSAQQENSQSELMQAEASLRQQQDELASWAGRLALYEELLGPTQENLDRLRQTLDATSEAIAKLQEASDYQLQAVAEVRQTVLSVADGSMQQVA